ncbi:MAG: ABC transporter substrate-binding protein, partial [Clostridiales bacterium]
KEQTEIVPLLATEWKTEDEGNSYIFKLREDAYFQKGKFQDGRQMKAEDVKYSLERSSKESALNRLPSVKNVEVLGDFEVKVNLTTADATFLTNLTNAGNVIVPKEEVEGHGDAFGTNLVGTGPFSLTEFKKDSHAKLERNDKYWGEKPHLDGANFKFITDPNMTVNALRTGELDVATDVSGEGIDIIKNEKNLEIKEVEGLHVAYIYMNQLEGPTKDKKVREAIAMAIDKDSLVKGVYQHGEATPASLPLPPGSWGY